MHRLIQWKKLCAKYKFLHENGNFVKDAKAACVRFARIMDGLQQKSLNSSLELFCLICGSLICPPECVDESELIIFDFGSKTTWLKYESDNTEQLSMHPTVSPVVLRKENGTDEIICPVCNKDRKPASKDENLKQVNQQVSKIYFKGLHCFDAGHDEDESGYMSTECMFANTNVANVASDLEQPTDALFTNATDATCETGNRENDERHLKAIFFLMRHVLERNTFHLRKNIPFVICEPMHCSEYMRQRLVKFAFEQLHVHSLCLIPKAVAVSLYVGLPTCLVVDSGARQTSVIPVFSHNIQEREGQAIMLRKQLGGMDISAWLLQAITMQLTDDSDFSIDVTRIDSSNIMRECWVAYNPKLEGRRSIPKKTLLVKGRKNGDILHREVKLSHELYLAAEDFYSRLELPLMISQVIKHFDQSTQRELMSNILLTGGNSKLTGLANRVTRDLQVTCAELRDVIHVRDPLLLSGRTDAVVGASYIRSWAHAEWITRGDYIIEGCGS